jgi:broad specificity polyphosphatase/5'/3'-nucleotidase SurE
MSDSFKYYAFISYNKNDIVWGKQLQRKLEHYRIPKKLCIEHNWIRAPIKPVFFAPSDIQPGGLNEELQEHLRNSRHLIVICSPNSARSEWVGKEIAFFHSLGRTQNIHFFIVDGTPHSGDPKTECLNPITDKLGLPEILGANIHERVYRWPWLNKERAFVQLISKLLGVEFDAIWQRHKRQLVGNAVLWMIGAALVITAVFGIWKANQSFDAEIRLSEASTHNEHLPPLRNAIVTMILDNETKTDTVFSLDSLCVFTNIPHRYLNKEEHFKITCKDFLELDTVMVLEKTMVMNVKRDPDVYGRIHFWLSNDNEEYVSNEIVYIDGIETISGSDGRVELFIPLEKQKRVYKISALIPLEVDTIIMPLAVDAVVRIK